MYEYLPQIIGLAMALLALACKKTKFELSTCAIKNLSDNENINSMMRARFLWQQLAQSDI